ncbi:Uncharacterized protein pbN1_16120 [Aromatoleum bremense]|nr:Uncharacterized protein pbN1_16120 [Aromatoleum bremense]
MELRHLRCFLAVAAASPKRHRRPTPRKRIFQRWKNWLFAGSLRVEAMRH